MAATDAPTPTSAPTCGGTVREQGFSLIELLIAMLLLGVILSALASSLIQFGSISVNNERRVQATAYLTQAHEQLQSIPWDQAAIYEGEVGQLADLDPAVGNTPPTFAGEPVVLLEDPADAISRLPFVPKAFADDVTVAERDYEIYQVVTWDPTVGTGNDVKRFTTVVRWNVGGDPFEQRFESTRAATAGEVEAAGLPEILSLVVAPGTIVVDEDGFNVSKLSISVTFDHGVDSASATIDGTASDVDLPLTTSLDVPLTPTDWDGAKASAFVGEVPVRDARFALGERTLTVNGLDGLTTITRSRTIDVVDAASGVAPVVTSATVNRTEVWVGTNGADRGRLCDTLTVRARADLVDGGVPAGFLVANYVSGTATGATMASPGTITGSNDEFTLEFAAGDPSPWEPKAPTYAGGSSTIKEAAVDVVERFDIVGENPDGGASTLVQTGAVTFRAKTENGGRCS